MRDRKVNGLIVLLLGCVATAHAQRAIRPACLSNENLRHFALPRSPQLSPDGRRVVFAVQEGAADLGVSHLWWANVEKPGNARQITFSPPSNHVGESQPQWMPDGSAILFLARRGKHRRIFRLPVTGGEASPLKIEYRAGQEAGATPTKAGAASTSTGAELNVASFEISPNGEWLAILAKDPETAKERQRQKEKRDAVVVDRARHPMRVWLYSMADESLTPLTSDQRAALSASWSPDSTQLAIVTRTPGDSDDLGPRHSVEIIALAHPHVSRIVTGIPSTVNRVSWSRSGSRFAFLAQSRHNVPPGVGDLYVIPVEGGQAADLTPEGAGIEGIPLWSKHDASILVQIQKGSRMGLARIPVSGGEPVMLETGFPSSFSFATNRAQTGWTFVAEASNRPPQVMFLRRFSAEAAPLTLSRANPAWPESGWQSAQRVEWKSSDGLAIHGLAFMPPANACSGAPQKPPFPLIVNVHGGPTGAFIQNFSPFVQFLLAQGWAVLEPNPRGSTGYGWRFVAANQNDLGDGDYKDIMAGLDWVVAHEPVDPHRLGLFGYSYGGEMAGFVEGRTTRFAAIVSGAPVIDQYSEYGTEDGSWYDRWFFGQPWKRPADAWRQSPLARAMDAHTPLLLLQGKADTTDPLGQSQEMYRALRQDHVAVKLVEFPRENHGGLALGILGLPSSEPWHGFEGRSYILQWFSSHFRPSQTTNH